MTFVQATDRLTADRRLVAFKELMDRHYQTPDDYDTGAEEDPRPYFAREAALGRYVCVTANPVPGNSDGKTFFLPRFDDLADAQARAIEFADDDVFAEMPVEIVDLDTGRRWHPSWSSLRWRAG